jgi:drug/metabolite transporter (DMT)-like permease
MREDISGRENTLLGNLFVFLNALSWGIYLVLVKPLMKKYHTVTILKWVFLMGLFMVAPFGWSGVSELDVQAWPSRIIWFALFVIVLTTFAAYLLNTYSLKALSPTVVSAYIYLQPLLTSLFAIYLFQNDRLTPGKIVSGVLIFLGVYLVSYSRKK